MIDVQITPEGLKEVSYVVVAMKLKDSNSETKGLLVGYRPIVDRDMDLATLQDRYIWLFREGCVHMFSTTYYDVDSIDVGVAQEKDPVTMKKSFGTDATSQIDARKMLGDIVDAMKENKMTEFNGLIKHSMYKLPDSYKDLITLKNAGSGSTSSVHKPASTPRTGTAGYNTGHTPYQNNIHNTNAWKRKEVTTANMKRTTRYDVGTAVAALTEKFKALATEEYVRGKLAKIPADSMPDNGEDATTGTGVYDDYSAYGY